MGSEKLSLMKLDHAYYVTGIGGCPHMFGRACVEQIVRNYDGGWLHCPFCRADWCYVISDDNLEDTNPMLYHC